MKLATFAPWALLTALAPAARSQSILHTFDGASADDQFGYSASAAGDVNGDGFEDIIVGARWDDTSGTDAGSATVFSGLDGTVLYSFYGDSPGNFFGHSVSGVGDVNGDGFYDLVVGAYRGNYARVFSGLDGSILYTFYGDSGGDEFGRSVSCAGDVNGDGYDDLIVGANQDDSNGDHSGSARVFSGVDGSVLYTFYGDSAEDHFGISVSGAGDVDGDGFADLIVGAYWDDNNGPKSGSARVFSGIDGSTLYTFDGDSAEDWLGWSVSSAGDVDGDGFADLIVGAFGKNNFSGSARVFSGNDGSILYTFNGSSTGDWFGWSVSDAGDVNKDGYADVIVGAFNDDFTGMDSGSAWIFSGMDGSVLHRFDGDSADDGLGRSVSAADVDGDGASDLIVGAARGGANGGGYARVFSGCDSCTAQIGTNYCTATTNSSGLPASIAGLGSEDIADNEVTLITTDVAPNQFGYYLMSDAQGFVPGFGGSQGNLCLGPPIVRFAKDVGFSGPAGVIELSLDLTALPQGTIFQPGETWNFQLWFRDVNPGFTSNTSDGLAITFQ